MPVYENKSDRERQQYLASMLSAYLGDNCNLVETDVEDRLCYDFVVRVGQQEWICEAKCRKYDEAFFANKGWLMEEERARNILWHAWLRGHGNAFFALLTSDRCGYIISLQKFFSNRMACTKAPDWMMKDDHGRKSAQRKTGWTIPLSLMTKIN